MYNINWWNLITILLPFSMRGKLRDIIYVLSRPFRILHHQLRNKITTTETQLSYNCQYPQLQRLLNDNFDKNYRGIRVKEGVGSVNGPVLYPEADWQPQIIGLLTIYSRNNWGYNPFLVEIPSIINMSGDPNDDTAIIQDDDTVQQIRRLVEIYKLSGTQYSIIYY